jgi:acyl-CoA synthetase (AMP-forming)/AMP-acid ligase II
VFAQELLKAEQGHARSQIPWVRFHDFLSVLEYQAEKTAGRLAYRFHSSGGASNIDLTFSQALEAAAGFGSALAASGANPGDRIGILLDTSPEFLHAYFGSMYAGCIPVCIALPAARGDLTGYLKRTAAILSDCQASWAVVDPVLLPASGELIKQAPSLRRVSAIADFDTAAPHSKKVRGTLDSVAMIQYTSGSTSKPRAVSVTHGALLGMVRALGQALWIHEGDVVANWLPFYHDMGLIGYVLTTSAHGARHHYLSPRQFIADPMSWLKLASRERATFSGGASFAYRLCVKALERDPEACAGLDLSSLTRAICGGERIPASLVRSFCSEFAPYGFAPEAFVPGYGLAENVLGVSYKRPGTPTRIVTVDRSELVSVGTPIPGCKVSISPDGEIVLDSDYSGASREVRTGDLGTISEGELFVSGRIKELIIRAGENIVPEDIEEACAAAPGVSLGPAVAVGLPSERTATENIVVVAEVRDMQGLPEAEVVALLSLEVLKRTGHSVYRFHLVGKGSIPRTSSGKLQRALVKRMLVEGRSP